MSTAYADRERNLATRDALALIRHGVDERRRNGEQVDYCKVAAARLHRSVATQARYLGIDVTGWARR